MRMRLLIPWLGLAGFLAVPLPAWPQAAKHNATTLVVTGHPGQAAVLQIGGKSYIDLESLARLTNASLSFAGNQIKLTLPKSASAATPPAATTPASPAGNPGFSKAFVRSGIETMSGIREWRSVIANIIQHSYPFDETWFTAYSAAAAKNLNLASLAATTDSDRSAFQLLSNEYNNMQSLTSTVLQNRNVMHYMPPGYLEDNPLNQKIVNCAQSLQAMAASNQFVDDGSCH